MKNPTTKNASNVLAYFAYQTEEYEVLRSHARTTNLTISNSIKRYHSERKTSKRILILYINNVKI